GLKADASYVDSVENELTRKIGNVEVTAEGAYITASEVRADLDGLEIGTRNYFAISLAEENKVIDWLDGNLYPESGSLASGFIESIPNAEYICNENVSQAVYYDSNKNHLPNSNQHSPGKSFVTPQNQDIKYMRISFRDNF